MEVLRGDWRCDFVIGYGLCTVKSPDPDYAIIRPLGEGGMAVVYLARHRSTGERVVIKLISNEFLGNWEITQRFDREARIMVQLDHPNIVRLRTWGVLRGGGRFLVLDLIEGKPLHDAVEAKGPAQPDVLHHVATDVLLGLAAAHRAGVVHRDLKPDNVMLTGASRSGLFDSAVLIDFGISRRRDVTAIVEPGITAANSVMGTPSYMAPEQAAADDIDHRADLYAFGCLLHFMAVGVPPFESHSPLTLLNMQIHDAPDLRPLRRMVRSELADLVSDLLQKKPDDRPSDASEVLVRLNAAHTARKHATHGKRRDLLGRIEGQLAPPTSKTGLAGLWSKLKGRS